MNGTAISEIKSRLNLREYLIEFKPFAVWSDNIKVFATVLPEFEKHRGPFHNIETIHVHQLEGLINIIYIKRHMIDVPVAPRGDGPPCQSWHLIKFKDNF